MGQLTLKDLGIKQTESKGELDKKLLSNADYLPQVRVYGSQNEVVKEGLFPMGHFGLYITKDNIIDLGKSFDCLVITDRPRAMIITSAKPVSYYDPESEEFNHVLAQSNAGKQGYAAGYEYLLWVPSVKQLGLFLMGSKTLRSRSAAVQALLHDEQGQPIEDLEQRIITFKMELVRGKVRDKETKEIKEFTWHAPEVFKCSTPIDLPEIDDKFKKQVEDFKNPSDESDMELADTEGEGRER